jgi:hypothetical protein
VKGFAPENKPVGSGIFDTTPMYLSDLDKYDSKIEYVLRIVQEEERLKSEQIKSE